MNGHGVHVEMVDSDLDVAVNNAECFHCSNNPDKFLPLPAEKQPYCSRCFDSMFAGLSMASTATVAPSAAPFSPAKENSNNDEDQDNNNMSPPPPPPILTRPPTVPPKPAKGSKPPILFSTLPQPFHSRSGSGSSGGSYSSTTGPVVAPSVPYTFTTPPTPPPPSPPPPFPQDTSANDSKHSFRSTPSPLSFASSDLPPPPPFETDLDNVDDDLLNSYNNQNQNVERRGYTSPLPSRIYINSSTIRSPTRTPSPTPIPQKTTTTTTTTTLPVDQLQQHQLPRSPPASPSFMKTTTKTTTTTTRTPATNSNPASPNLNRNSASGLYNNFNSQGKKFDYKTFASIPKPADDEDSSTAAVNKPLQKTTFKSPGGSNHSSDSDSDSKSSKKQPAVSVSVQKSLPTATHSNPISTIGSWVQKQQQQLQQQQQQQKQPVATTSAGTGSSVVNQRPVEISNTNQASQLKKSVSIEQPEETHLDQLNSIFKMSSLKDKQQQSPYRGGDFSGENSTAGGTTLGKAGSKPPITAAKPNFACSRCKVNLLGKTVESKSGKVFCSPCYRTELANQPGCFKCGGDFTSETSLVTYKGADWHAECFRCEKCKMPIGAKTFCNQKDGIFCADCYFESSGRKCVKCKKYLKSTGFLFRNEPWHHECFLCTSCNKPLGDNQILCKDDQPYCATCYDQNYLEKCVKCHKILVGETVEYESQQYHDHCFCCAECEAPIGSTSFYPREGNVYCEPCFTRKYAKKCQKCAEIISPSNGFGLVYKQTHYHRQCFNCTNCSKSLANIAVHSTKTSDDPFCGDCYDELYSKRCTSCNNIISGVIGSKFMSFEGRYWHVECFNCKLCQTSLENRKFFPSQGEMLCIACSRYNPYNNSQQ